MLNLVLSQGIFLMRSKLGVLSHRASLFWVILLLVACYLTFLLHLLVSPCYFTFLSWLVMSPCYHSLSLHLVALPYCVILLLHLVSLFCCCILLHHLVVAPRYHALLHCFVNSAYQVTLSFFFEYLFGPYQSQTSHPMIQ